MAGFYEYVSPDTVKTTVYVSDFQGDGTTTSFTLTANPFSENNTQVYIDGVYQEKTGYSVLGTVLTFSQAPPNLSGIEVTMLAAEEIQIGTTSADLVSYTPAGAGAVVTDVQTELRKQSASDGTVYTPAGTGAVATTVQAKLRESVSVKDFGAKGDGTTDDTAAIKLALTYGTGKVILFPSGVYIVDGSLLELKSETTIIGYGATLKLKAGTYATTQYFLGTATGITYDAAISRFKNITILGIEIDGNISNVTLTGSAGCYGINIYQTDLSVVRDVIIKNLAGTSGTGYGLVFSYSSNIVADNVTIDRTDRQNIIVWETLDANIVNCSLKDSYFRECILISSNSPVLYQNSYARINGCKCDNTLNPTTDTHVVRFSGFGSGIIESCEILGSTNAVAQVEGIYIVNGVDQRVTIANNRIKNCYSAIFIETTASGKDALISGNDIFDCTNGIRINATIDNISVCNNFVTVTDSPLYINGAFYQNISGNSFSGGSVASSIINSSSGGLGATVVNGNLWESITSASYVVLISATGVVPVVSGNTVANSTANIIKSVPNSIFVGNTGGVVDGVATSGVIVKRSTTANRPTLGSTDIGVLFLDTTLDADGKPIFWTGTAWVDGTGAVV